MAMLTKRFSYNGQRIMQQIIDEEGRRTEYGIDSLGRRISESVYDAGNTLVQQTFFAYGDSRFPGFMTRKTVKKQAPDNALSWATDLVTAYEADANGYLARETVDPDGLSLSTCHVYDAQGNKLQTTDPNGNSIWFTYDKRNRLVRAVYADGGYKSFGYDARGNKVWEYFGAAGGGGVGGRQYGLAA